MVNKFFIIVFFIIFLCPLIIADLGLSSDYHNENPIRIDLGNTEEVVIGRMINTGEEEINLEIELLEGLEIAQIINEKLTVPANGKTELKIEISIPEDAIRGNTYNLVIKYKQVSPVEGMIVITSSNTISVPVVVGKLEEVKEDVIKKNIIWIILGILVIIILVVVI